jgi:hypothetical protein
MFKVLVWLCVKEGDPEVDLWKMVIKHIYEQYLEKVYLRHII